MAVLTASPTRGRCGGSGACGSKASALERRRRGCPARWRAPGNRPRARQQRCCDAAAPATEAWTGGVAREAAAAYTQATLGCPGVGFVVSIPEEEKHEIMLCGL
eukprot:2272715-Pleurochrysis_carterae.AAC.3